MATERPSFRINAQEALCRYRVLSNEDLGALITNACHAYERGDKAYFETQAPSFIESVKWWPERFPRAKIPAHVRAAVLAKAKHKCARCSSPDNLQIDHVFPHSKGGSDSIENLQALCRTCNCRKAARVNR
jgi:hypothetical protein